MATLSPQDRTTNGELVRRLFALLNDTDYDALRRYWTPQTVERFPDATCHGVDAIVAYFENLFAALPDCHIEIVALAEQGDDVFVHWLMTGTHDGAPFHGIDPTGRAIALDGIDHFVIRDGVVASNFIVFDQMQFARAVGLLPPDGSRADRGLKGAFNARTRLVKRLRR